MTMSLEDVRERLRRVINSRAPGLYDALELECITTYGMSCIDILLEDPVKLLDVIARVYRDKSSFTVMHVFRIVFLRPLISELLVKELEEGLLSLLRDNPEEFKIKIRRLLGVQAS
ncbi:MAG: hypothetical protein P3X22_005610 [Thermoprotei archaeon]|nr:hypothetical protein [Thermoprotei archaeon]